MKSRTHLHSLRTNVGKESHPDSRVAQGDFPTKIKTLSDVRSDVLESDLNTDGSLEAGTSCEKDMYNPEGIDNGFIFY